MSIRITKTHVCDRCGEDFFPREHWNRNHIGDLVFMVKRNNSGSRDSNMAMDLCFDCTEIFLNFIYPKRNK